MLTTTLLDRPLASRFTYRENRVPHYQRLFQAHDGVRQWNKVCLPLSHISLSLSMPISVCAAGAEETCNVVNAD